MASHDVVVPCRREVSSHLRIAQESAKCVRDSSWLMRRDQNSSRAVFHDFRSTAGSSRDDRFACHHRLNDRRRHRLSEPRAQNEDVEHLIEERFFRAVTCEMNDIGQAGPAHSPTQTILDVAFLAFPGPDKDQSQPREFSVELVECVEQILGALPLDESAHVADHCLATANLQARSQRLHLRVRVCRESRKQVVPDKYDAKLGAS
jgi:hypothetical protein